LDRFPVSLGSSPCSKAQEEGDDADGHRPVSRSVVAVSIGRRQALLQTVRNCGTNTEQADATGKQRSSAWREFVARCQDNDTEERERRHPRRERPHRHLPLRRRHAESMPARFRESQYLTLTSGVLSSSLSCGGVPKVLEYGLLVPAALIASIL
jgi:hypothetical protein